jgi:hypothetical protein
MRRADARKLEVVYGRPTSIARAPVRVDELLECFGAEGAVAMLDDAVLNERLTLREAVR